MRLAQRREYDTSYRDSFACGGHSYNDAILYDVVVPWLGVTLARYRGPRWGWRTERRRLAVDLGHWAFLFWAFAPRRLT